MTRKRAVTDTRWLRIMSMYADGMNRRQIAAQLRISESVVRDDMRFARWALDARTTTQAVANAIRSGRIK